MKKYKTKNDINDINDINEIKKLNALIKKKIVESIESKPIKKQLVKVLRVNQIK
jgi:hypothetical protein